MNDLYAKLAEILDVTRVSADDEFANFELWDSLSKLATVAMLDASFGVVVSGQELGSLQTVSELEALIQKKV